MYGLPGQTVDLFADTLHRILKHSVVRHLSAYELTIVPVTPFGRHQRLLPLPDDDTVIEMYALLEEISLRYRFDHYEVSNFSRKGHRCRHNENYWNHQPYIGLGCSAHSYIHPRRFWNFKDINRYITTLSKGQNPVEGEELLSEGMLAREMVFLGFRKKEGVNERLFNERTGFHFKAWAGEERLQQFIDNKLLIYDSPWWRPTEKGMMSADFLARELI
jgi:oxygen-independent coproporphyrinogen-3 oxidase